MQPDSIRAAARIPNLAFSDIVDFPIENSAPTRQIERPKPGDSMEGIIVDAIINSQSIRVRSALQQPGCVFFAARFFAALFPPDSAGGELRLSTKKRQRTGAL